MIGFDNPEWDQDVPENQQLQQLAKKSKFKKDNREKSKESEVNFSTNTTKEVKKKKSKKNKELSVFDVTETIQKVNKNSPKGKKSKKKRKKSNKTNDEAVSTSNTENGEKQSQSDVPESMVTKKKNKKRKKPTKNVDMPLKSDLKHSESDMPEPSETKKQKKKRNKNVGEEHSSNNLQNTESNIPETIQSKKKNKKKKSNSEQLTKADNPSNPQNKRKLSLSTDTDINEPQIKKKKTDTKNKNAESSTKGKNALKKSQKRKPNESSPQPQKNYVAEPGITKPKNSPMNKQMQKLKRMLSVNASLGDGSENSNVKLEDFSSNKLDKNNPKSLRDRMMERLKSARFRYINEQIYVTESRNTEKFFKEDPEAFTAYHEGYRQQVRKWPLNPLDVIIKDISTLPKEYIIADLGCGDARLAKSVTHKVHSFDLVSTDPMVRACDMAHTPLLTSQVNVVVFCLSLMGTNLKDYIIEANRVLKTGGLLKIAEVESRFEDVNEFVKNVQKYGFTSVKSDLNNNLFYFMDFKKESDIKKRNKLPQLVLKACIYKKR